MNATIGLMADFLGQKYFNTLSVEQISCGNRHSLALLSDGSLWASGDNASGQMGKGDKASKATWKCVMASDSSNPDSEKKSGVRVVQVSAGGDHSLALKSDGSVWATGWNAHGQLGDGTTAKKFSWVQVLPPGSGVVQVSAGTYHSLALKSDGSVLATGDNRRGECGRGRRTRQIEWECVIGPGIGSDNDPRASAEVIQVAAGVNHSLALKSDGSVWATGMNECGELGDGTVEQSNIWKCVMTSGASQIAAGTHYSLALKLDGSVWATGYNKEGQLGDGSTTNRATWDCVMPAGSNVVYLAAGGLHSLALKADGSVLSTGFGSSNDKTAWNHAIAASLNLPAKAEESRSKATQIAAGTAHAIIIGPDGTLWGRGANDCGQLGYGGLEVSNWAPDRFFDALLLNSVLSKSTQPGIKRNIIDSDDLEFSLGQI
jgi:alpha-tubulin suppressor-like RCC1 family protein